MSDTASVLSFFKCRNWDYRLLQKEEYDARDQAAIPLATLSTERVTYLYELMDAAYDAEEIGWHSYLSGHVPIIDVNTRRDKDWKKERPGRLGPSAAPDTRIVR